MTVEETEAGTVTPADMVAPARDGGIWVTRMHAGLLKYRGGKLVAGPIPFPATAPVSMNVCEDSTGNVWLSTGNAGLFRYSPDGRWQVFSAANGLSHDSIRCVYEDLEGNLWVGTDGGGLNRIRRAIVEVWDRRHGLAGDVALSVTEDARGRLWVGLNGQGLSRLINQKFEQVLHPGRVEAACAPWSIVPDRHDGIWLSVGNDGELVHVRAGGAELFPNPEPSRRFYVRSLLQDREGILWIGTYGDGDHRRPVDALAGAKRIHTS